MSNLAVTVTIKDQDSCDEDGAMKHSEEKELKKILKGEKIKLVKQFYRSCAVYRSLVINLGCSSQGVDAKYLMSRKRKNIMQIARSSINVLCELSARNTSKDRVENVAKAINDLVCCFEYLLNIFKLEYRIHQYMQSQKFPSNQILLIKTGLPMQAQCDKTFGIKYLVVKNFELSTWIQKDIKELEGMIESTRNTSLVKPWDIAPGYINKIQSPFSATSFAFQAFQFIPVGHPGRNKKRKIIIAVGSLSILSVIVIILATTLSLAT